MELFNDFMEPYGAFSMLSRAGHVLAGITWIGLLYFFNFVQTPAYAQLSDGARGEALRKLTFRALWWFRWAALATVLFGLAIISVQEMEDGAYFSGQGGTAILTGILFGLTMFLNVWGVIWRAQKRIIASSEAVAAGGTADPEVTPELIKGAARASRCNTFFSITMLFFMVFAAHGGAFWGSTTSGTLTYWVVVLILWAFVELSALGFIGGLDSPFNKLAFDDHKKTIIFGFVYLALIYIVGWEGLLPV